MAIKTKNKILIGIGSLVIVVALISGYFGPTENNQNNLQSTKFLLYTPWPKLANEHQIKFIAEHYAVTEPQQHNPDVNKIKKYNPDIHVVMYQNLKASTPTRVDWGTVNQHEDWFMHSTDSLNKDDRIQFKFSSDLWLMNITNPEYVNHWINLATEKLSKNNYDGIFCDDANQILQPGYFADPLPPDYSDEVMSQAVYDMLKKIKEALPDKIVIFNGLFKINQGQYTGVRNLEVTDGGTKEGFVIKTNGDLISEEEWKSLMDLILANSNEGKSNLLLDKSMAEGGISTESRLFCFTSFLLVKDSTTIYGLIDKQYIPSNLDAGKIQYYPEYDVDLGEPLETKTSIAGYLKNGVYERNFENGKILVNPSNSTKIVSLGQTYRLVKPIEGGAVTSEGTTDGKLEYEDVNQVTINSQTGIILLKE